MRIRAGWFVDRRIESFIQTYLFALPNPSHAYPGPITEQPHIWIEAKMIIDKVYQHQQQARTWLI